MTPRTESLAIIAVFETYHRLRPVCAHFPLGRRAMLETPDTGTHAVTAASIVVACVPGAVHTDMAWMTSDPSAFLAGPCSTSLYTPVGRRRF